MDYEKFCKQCQYYDFSLQSGILCGLTKEKPAFENSCDKFLLDPERTKSNKLTVNNIKKSIRRDLPELSIALRKWGIGLIGLGLLHLILTQFLNPIWGFLIIILGVINLTVKKKEMLIANGISLVLVGLMNISVMLFPGESNIFWIIFGLFQIFLGIKEIQKYNLYKQEEEPEIEASQNSSVLPPLDIEEGKVKKHSGLGISSFIIFCTTFIILIITLVYSAIIGISNPEGLDKTSPTMMIIGFSMLFNSLLSMVGVGLAIAGLVNKNKKKVYSILGLVFNTIIVLTFVLLFLVGAGSE